MTNGTDLYSQAQLRKVRDFVMISVENSKLFQLGASETVRDLELLKNLPPINQITLYSYAYSYRFQTAQEMK